MGIYSPTVDKLSDTPRLSLTRRIPYQPAGVGGLVKQIAAFVQWAKEAEARAALLEDEALKGHWRDIAVGYRNLAQARQMLLASGATSEPAFPSRDGLTSLQN